MNLVFYDWNLNISFKENIVNVLVIENKICFRNIIEELIDNIDGVKESIILSENDKQLKISKYVELIESIFFINLNNTKFIKKVIEELKDDAVSENNFLKTNALLSLVDKNIGDLIANSRFNLSYEPCSINNLLKNAEIRFDYTCETIVEKIMNYLELCNKVLGIKIFIFINIKDLFTEKEFKELYKFCNYIKINLFLVENEEGPHLDSEKYYIIDENLNEIY
ncbi:MAG: type II-A CRISPR-associated protein Csn2 [Erysipelotrichaceae bacterium]|nr:type II-A CRISPR-associated protein Csn2 [Erysipelotrichaceae bacterium]